MSNDSVQGCYRTRASCSVLKHKSPSPKCTPTPTSSRWHATYAWQRRHSMRAVYRRSKQREITADTLMTCFLEMVWRIEGRGKEAILIRLEQPSLNRGEARSWTFLPPTTQSWVLPPVRETSIFFFYFPFTLKQNTVLGGDPKRTLQSKILPPPTPHYHSTAAPRTPTLLPPHYRLPDRHPITAHSHPTAAPPPPHYWVEGRGKKKRNLFIYLSG